jgi:hypothetical protein
VWLCVWVGGEEIVTVAYLNILEKYNHARDKYVSALYAIEVRSGKRDQHQKTSRNSPKQNRKITKMQ